MKSSLVRVFACSVGASALVSSASAGLPIHENGIYQFNDGVKSTTFHVLLDRIKVPPTATAEGKFLPTSGSLSAVAKLASASEAATKRPHDLTVTLDSDRTLYTLKRQVLVHSTGAMNGRAIAKKIGATGYFVPSTSAPTVAIFTFAGPADCLAGAEALLNVPGTISALPLLGTNSNRAVAAIAPKDPYYISTSEVGGNGRTWHLRDTGTGVSINAAPAWAAGFQGVGARMTFLDDGVQNNHEDLQTNLLVGFDWLGGTYIARHGTAVAGYMAAASNTKGGLGVAYLGKIMPLRIASDSHLYIADELVYNPNNRDLTYDNLADTDIQRALFYSPSISVSNSSWTFSGITGTPNATFPNLFGATDTLRLTFYPADPTAIHTGLTDAGAKGRGGRGCMMVFAAGNDYALYRDTNDSPLTNHYISTPVAGLTRLGGGYAAGNPGASLVASAPAVGAITTDRTGSAGYNPSGGDVSNQSYTRNFGGTSASAAIVSGAMGVLTSAKPTLGARDVWEILARTSKGPAQGIGSALEAQQRLTYGVLYHTSHLFGFGLPDLGAATAMATAPGFKLLTADYQKEIQATDVTNVTIPARGPTGLVKHFRVANAPRIRLEKVELSLTVEHPNPAGLYIELSSAHAFPTATTGRIYSAVQDLTLFQLYGIPGRNLLPDRRRPNTWTYTTTMHYGECAGGDWHVRIQDTTGNAGTVSEAKLTLHGGAGPRPTTIPEITINPALTDPTDPLYSAMPDGIEYCSKYVGYQIVATTCPYSYQALGLPAGLTIDAITGLISGTPYENGDFLVTLKATNEIGTAVKVATLHVDPRVTVPNVIGGYLGIGAVGEPFVMRIEGSGGARYDHLPGVEPTRWTFVSDNGIKLSTAPLPYFGQDAVLNGIPLSEGTYNYTITASNYCGFNKEQLDPKARGIPFIVVIAPANQGVGSALDVPGQAFSLTPGSEDMWFWGTTNFVHGNGSLVSPIFPAGHKAGITTTVQGPVKVEFDWMSNDHVDDHVNFYVDGVLTKFISGSTPWTHVNDVPLLPAGPHILAWEFDNATVATGGEDRGRVDHLQLIYSGLSTAIGWPQPVTSYGASVWTEDVGPPVAAKSGPVPVDGQKSSMEIAVTGPGVLTFDWLVSSSLDEDFLSFSLDGNSTLVPAISGEDMLAYAPVVVNIPAGLHSIRWTYTEGGDAPIPPAISSPALGSDAGWVKHVVFTPSL